MALQVIGTGFGRTGTDSMREALDILGFGPCHHMRALMADADHKQMWRDRAVHGAPDWDRIFDGFGACVDWPSAQYWPELIDHYPDAKVLLTWRTAESWWESFSKTILPVVLASEDTEENAPGSKLVDRAFGWKPLERDHCIAVYEANVQRVLAEVPPGRLLVHRIGDGWEPLCAHLGVEVPDVPYPRSNSTKSFQDELGVEANG